MCCTNWILLSLFAVFFKFQETLSLQLMNSRITAVATWKFGTIGLDQAVPCLLSGGTAVEAVEKGINAVELDNEDQYYVGVGGHPNRDGIMELDAAIMDHDLRYGAVMSLPDISRPISVARTVMTECQHNILTGNGALQWALDHGFQKERILTPEIEKEYYEWKLQQVTSSSNSDSKQLVDEDQHDTIGMICLDQYGHLAAGTSTSG